MPARTGAIEKYWPTTQSLDMVEGPVEAVAKAVEAEVRRFNDPELVEADWVMFRSLEEAFAACRLFTNVPTFYLVLPTRSRWTVLWNNNFLCDGYDSLCHCVSQNHGMTTLHWSAHDESTTFQPGASFTHRTMKAGAVVERSVYCGRVDRRWTFHESGSALPEEDTSAYGTRQTKERLNESAMLSLLERLGARPWDEAFYDAGVRTCFVVRRPNFPTWVIKRQPNKVLLAV
jgi:hypothetical protein